MPRLRTSRSLQTIARCAPSRTISCGNSTLPRRLARLERVNTLKVELGDRSYPILIGEGLLRQPQLLRQYVAARDILVVSNTTVAPLYMESLTASLGGGRIVEAILPDGEAH